MASVNEDLQDIGVRHAVDLSRFTRSIIRDLIPILNKADIAIVRELLKRGPTLSGTITSKRMKYLLDAIREINRDAYIEIGRRLRSELRGLAKEEVQFQTDGLKNALPIAVSTVAPSAEMLHRIVVQDPINGKFLRDWVKDLSENKIKRIRDTIRQGMVRGQTNQQIVRSIRGTKARNFRDGVLSIDRRHMSTWVQTAVQDIAGKTRHEIYKANDDIIKGYQWISTLDARTCPQCMALDGRVFKTGEGPLPIESTHVNCRCTTAPVVRSWKELGIDIGDAPEGTRASLNGQVPSTITYNQWLRKQSASIQNDALGPTRAKLFRDGKLSVTRFTDRQGNLLTLDQLRERNRSAFRKADV